ncbi:uncharacterized protein BCR38DRAFT_375394 [Pseudomassariella vexata]|uniref:Uncharacterized protein n=1 Tax=Pseudomassariella vexata TaxID=1141098 RepID=A0A1Y2DM78_9PEZI|nr:uncharacterized protein BCR38DRAFT_375394 [Pseudomassariella vexata]ORY60249.1 hypothetical protein BCR38DRAFT_375394 [Pseudomassariella vexata]
MYIQTSRRSTAIKATDSSVTGSSSWRRPKGIGYAVPRPFRVGYGTAKKYRRLVTLSQYQHSPSLLYFFFEKNAQRLPCFPCSQRERCRTPHHV